MDSHDLKHLTRAKLQRLAKTLGVKANQKTVDIIRDITLLRQSQSNERSNDISTDLAQELEHEQVPSRAVTEPLEEAIPRPRTPLASRASPSRPFSTLVQSRPDQAQTSPQSRAGSPSLERSPARAEPPSTQGRGRLQPAVWSPIVVGEREGEPAFHQNASTSRLSTRATPPFYEDLLRDASQLRHVNTRQSPAYSGADPESILRPGNVPGMYSSPSGQPATPRKGTPPPRTSSPRPDFVKKIARPSVRELEDILFDVEDKVNLSAQAQLEIQSLVKILGVIRNKEQWMKSKMSEVQRTRLALEHFWMMKAKVPPALQEEPPASVRKHVYANLPERVEFAGQTALTPPNGSTMTNDGRLSAQRSRKRQLDDVHDPSTGTRHSPQKRLRR